MTEPTPSSDIEQLTTRINQLESKIVELEVKKSKAKSTIELEHAECEICHRIFANKYTLKTHFQHKHNEDRERFNCPICRKELSSKYYLAKHISVKHSQ